jgi:predicted nucleic acid-binding protein
MTPAPFACVVDASVAVQLFIAEPLTPLATSLFDLLAGDPGVVFHVPDLFYAECANIFWKQVQRSLCPDATAQAAMANVHALRLQSAPTAGLTTEALQLALNHAITAYDACYVALSRWQGVPLITADEKLVRKLSGISPTVVWLGSWAPPTGGAP